jgi:hypothetical protein
MRMHRLFFARSEAIFSHIVAGDCSGADEAFILDRRWDIVCRATDA